MKLHSSLTTVNPISKFLAMLLFVLLPFVGFYLGVQYGKSAVTPQSTNLYQTYWEKEKTKVENNSLITQTRYEEIAAAKTPSSWETYTNTMLGYQISYPPTYTLRKQSMGVVSITNTDKTSGDNEEELNITLGINYWKDIRSIEEEYILDMTSEETINLYSEIAKTTINSMPALYLRSTKNPNLIMLRVFYPGSNKELIISKLPTPSTKEKEFRQIISTLRLLPSK